MRIEYDSVAALQSVNATADFHDFAGAIGARRECLVRKDVG